MFQAQSKNSQGPCLSGVYDPKTGQTFYGQNFKTGKTNDGIYQKWLTEEADPIIQKMESEYARKIQSGEIKLSDVADHRYAAHSEIQALDQAIKARRAAGIPVDEKIMSELYLQNVDLRIARETGEIVAKARCEHCRYLTDEINLLNNTQ